MARYRKNARFRHDVESRKRVEMLQACARQKFPGMKLFVVDQTENFWEDPQEFNSDLWEKPLHIGERVCHATGEQSGSQIRHNRQFLFSHTPSFKTLLCEHNVTAMALRDTLAREYLLWLREAGYSLPGDVSLVSFDNRFFTQILQISSVDFCFFDLGYLAAHTLLDDISVKYSETGNCTVSPVLVMRQSSGPVR